MDAVRLAHFQSNADLFSVSLTINPDNPLEADTTENQRVALIVSIRNRTETGNFRANGQFEIKRE